jgi:hypothetical protein
LTGGTFELEEGTIRIVVEEFPCRPVYCPAPPTTAPVLSQLTINPERAVATIETGEMGATVAFAITAFVHKDIKRVAERQRLFEQFCDEPFPKPLRSLCIRPRFCPGLIESFLTGCGDPLNGLNHATIIVPMGPDGDIERTPAPTRLMLRLSEEDSDAHQKLLLFHVATSVSQLWPLVFI